MLLPSQPKKFKVKEFKNSPVDNYVENIEKEALKERYFVFKLNQKISNHNTKSDIDPPSIRIETKHFMYILYRHKNEIIEKINSIYENYVTDKRQKDRLIQLLVMKMLPKE